MSFLPNQSFFFPLPLSVLVGTASKEYTPHFRVIGKGEIGREKKKRFIVLQHRFCGETYKIPVYVPESVTVAIGNNMTFIRKSARKKLIRINPNRRRSSETGASISIYPDPKTGARLRWEKSLLYELVNKDWKLVEVDGRQVSI